MCKYKLIYINNECFVFRQAVGSVLPDVVLDGDDQDIMYGDYVDYTVDTPWLRADNVTKRLYVQQLIALGPGWLNW